MNTPTYKEQFDKLTAAYINNEVNPYDACACFVGNLLNNKGAWAFREWTGQRAPYKSAVECVFKESNGFYTPKEMYMLEYIFISNISDNTPNSWFRERLNDANYENALFIAFEKTLEALKALHISKGEVIEEAPIFNKRVLQTA